MSQIKKLNLSQIDEGRKKALMNAEGLVNDARVLLQNNSYARAFFLSQLSLEEMGKYIILISAASNPALQRMDWNRFWKLYKFHESDDRNFEFLRFIFIEIENLKDQMKYINELYGKNTQEILRGSSLYSDFLKNGFYGPTDTITSELAAFWVSVAERYLSSFRYYDENFIGSENFSKLQKKE
jgi:AbiV family abortive infection protein